MRLIKGDCLEEMDKLIAEGIKVDAIITDPPYGTTACKWDSVIPFDDMWIRLKALRKDRTPIVLFGSEPFSSALRMSNIREYKYDWVWDKKKGANVFNVKYQPLKYHEILSVFYYHNYYPIYRIGKPRQDVYKTNRSELYGGGENVVNCINNGKQYNPISIIEFSNANNKNKLHPTQKPVTLMEYLIKTYTNEGDTVLDFTMGSGTTGLACKNLNRHFIGIERDEKYFAICEERIKA